MVRATVTGADPLKIRTNVGAASPIATTRANLGAAANRGERSTPLAWPPAMRTASATPSSAASAACGFVALESSTNRTEPAFATTAPRCGSGAKDPSAARTASPGTPNARAAAAAAVASETNARPDPIGLPSGVPSRPRPVLPPRRPLPRPAVPTGTTAPRRAPARRSPRRRDRPCSPRGRPPLPAGGRRSPSLLYTPRGSHANRGGRVPGLATPRPAGGSSPGTPAGMRRPPPPAPGGPRPGRRGRTGSPRCRTRGPLHLRPSSSTRPSRWSSSFRSFPSRRRRGRGTVALPARARSTPAVRAPWPTRSRVSPEGHPGSPPGATPHPGARADVRPTAAPRCLPRRTAARPPGRPKNQRPALR